MRKRQVQRRGARGRRLSQIRQNYRQNRTRKIWMRNLVEAAEAILCKSFDIIIWNKIDFLLWFITLNSIIDVLL